jgi:Flp pilus assembly pilin Flp
MASVGGVPEFDAGWPSGRVGRRELPRSLSVALVLVHTLFAFTVLGGLGLLLTAASYDALDGGVIALVAYAAAPGTLGWWLARRSWEGGPRVRRGLIAVQVWLILGGLANLAAGSDRGGLQLFLPIVILYFLLQSESRKWYELIELDRAERRPFSLARMIRWRRDDGQTAVEYAGLIAIVAAIITALLVTGLGTQIYGGIEAQVCKVTGMGCPAPSGGGTDVRAGKDNAGGDGNTRVSTDGTTAGTGNGADNPADDTRTTGNNDDNGTDNPDQKDDGGDKSDGKKDDGCFSGFGAFFGCAGNQIKQVGQGLFVDGVWGDLTGIYDLVRHPLNTLKGIGDYGKQLGHDWMENSKDARDKWSKGDYLGAVLDWGGASLKTGGTVLYDLFIGDDVADDWNNGHKTRAVSHVIWNIGSLFIPGYDVAKVGEKIGDLGKLGRLGKLGKLAEKAGEAAKDAKKAAKAGDVAGAEKAAKEADDAAEEAEKKARQSGCTISAPSRRVPYDGTSPAADGALTGSSGTGTAVLAAGASDSPYVVLAEGGCDEDAENEAEEARKQADQADKAADRWEAGDDVPGPAGGKTLRFPNKRHTVGGAGSGQVKERNTVILRGNEDLVRADIEGIAKGRAKLLPDGNTYEINGRQYGIEDTGTVFPKSGPGLVDMDRIEYAALKEIVRNKGDLGKSQQLQRDPKFVNNPDKVAKAKRVYDGTFK